MIHPATTAIHEYFRATGFQCDIDERGDFSAVVGNFRIHSGETAIIHFISEDDDNDVAIRSFDFYQGDAAALLPVVNQLNCDYRFVKFTLQDNGSVCMEMDIPVETEDVGKVAFELLVRSLDILSHASEALAAAGASRPDGEAGDKGNQA